MTISESHEAPPGAGDIPAGADTASPAEPQMQPRLKSQRASALSRWGVAILVIAFLALMVYSGIRSRSRAEASLEQATRAAEIPWVRVIYPQAGSAAGELVLPGNTQAFIDTPIYARTSGYLKHWRVDIGAHVKKGQILAEIEAPELDQQLEEAQAELKSAQANLAIARVTAARWQNLLKTHSVSQQETDQAVSDLASRQALAASSQANVRRLEQLQSYERIYAPFDGVITARNTDIGALIQGGDNSSPKELFHLAAIGRLRVYIAVPEVDSAAIRTGEKASLTFDAFPGQTFTGILVRDSDAIDPVSRTLKAEVDVDNPTGRLMPGAYTFVHLKIAGSPGAVTIPANTLLFRSEGLRAGVVRDGRVKLTPIAIGHDYGSSVEVISGLTPQDAVVIDPSDSLADGDAVRVENPRAPEP